MNKLELVRDLQLLWPHVARMRRLQLFGLLGLMLLTSVAELISLGAVVPFITALSRPQDLMRFTLFEQASSQFGLSVQELAVLSSALFAVLVLLASAVRLLLLRASNRLVYAVGHDLGVAVFDSTLGRPYIWHVTHNSSEIIAGVNKVELVVQGYLLVLMNGCVASVLAVGMVIMLVLIDPFVALAGAGAFAVVYVLIALSVRRQIVRNGVIIARTNGERIRFLQEGLGGIRDVILDHAQRLYVEQYARADLSHRTAQASNNVLSGAPRLAIEGVGLFILAIACSFATRSGNFENLLPVLGALGLGAQKLMPLVQTVYSAWASISTYRPSLHDVVQLLENRPSAEGGAAYKDIGSGLSFAKSITLSDVCYSYPQAAGQQVLRDINLSIRQGACIGIVGKTGSGKTTLADLLMGLLQPTSGVCLIDGVALDAPQRLRQWRHCVSHVPQSIFLSDASVAENIAFGVPADQIDLQRVHSAAELAEVHADILALPAGYQSSVGERGVRLSGGQRQRIGIARALYRNSAVLVLDEATSALDSRTEHAVIRNIHQARRDLTIIMIAHRISTLSQCDLIVHMQGGQIIHLQTYQDLLAQSQAQMH